MAIQWTALLLVVSFAEATWHEMRNGTIRNFWEEAPHSVETVRAMIDLKRNPPPTVFQIGEQKCGSSTLFSMLHQHTDICKAKVFEGEHPWTIKELFFFRHGTSHERLIQGFPRYLEHFEDCPSRQLRVDASPGYMSYSAVAPMIKKVYTEMGIDVKKLKFLVILRDPVHRTISAFEHKTRRHWIENGTTLDGAIKSGIDRYQRQLQQLSGTDRFYLSEGNMVGRGVYAPALRHWFSHFDSSQFMVLTLEQLNRDTAGATAAVQSFLGLEIQDLPLSRKNVGHYEPHAVPESLTRFFSKPNEELFKLKDEHPEAFYETSNNAFDFAA